MFKKFKKQSIAFILLVVTMLMGVHPSIVYARSSMGYYSPSISNPDDENFTKFIELNDSVHIKENAWLGNYFSFTAPETGQYQIKLINIDNNGADMAFFNNYWQGVTIDNPRADVGFDFLYDNLYGTDGKQTGIVYKFLNKDEILNIEVKARDAWLSIEKTPQTTTTTKTPAINKKSVSFSVGDRQTLKIKHNKKEVKWVSTNSKVVTVSKSGVIKAKRAGTAYVWAIVENKAYKCKVKVSI